MCLCAVNFSINFIENCRLSGQHCPALRKDCSCVGYKDTLHDHYKHCI